MSQQTKSERAAWALQDPAAERKRRAGLRAEWRQHHLDRAEYWRRYGEERAAARCVDRATHEGVGVAPCRDPRVAGRCFSSVLFSRTPHTLGFSETPSWKAPFCGFGCPRRRAP
jgi:hypothetical protein